MRWTFVAAGLLGASAIALGAFGAHGLPARLEGLGYAGEDLARRLANFDTAARYQLFAATALLAIGVAPREASAGRRSLVRSVAAGLVLGSLVFSGLLYTLVLVGPEWRFLGAIVPIGGLAMIAAWLGIAVAGFGKRADAAEALPSPSSATLVRVEELLSHQQHLISQLDDALRAHRNETDHLTRRLLPLEDAVKRLADAQRSGEDLPHEKPPHY
ncbi:MAG: SlyX family protein [Lacipirellulaceae bacterium]